VNPPLDDASRRRIGRVATIAALTLAFVISFAFVAFSIVGFWICGGIAHSSDDEMLGASKSLFVTLRFVLSWLVLFGPFALAGVWMLRYTLKKAFGKQDERWLYPFRVFMAVVSVRIAAEQARSRRLQAENEKVVEGE
jgi:hypothetical protein